MTNVDKPTLLEQIADDERALFALLKDRAVHAARGVVLEHSIDALHESIDKKRAALRRIENAADIVSRRTAGNRRQQQRRTQ